MIMQNIPAFISSTNAPKGRGKYPRPPFFMERSALLLGSLLFIKLRDLLFRDIDNCRKGLAHKLWPISHRNLDLLRTLAETGSETDILFAVLIGEPAGSSPDSFRHRKPLFFGFSFKSVDINALKSIQGKTGILDGHAKRAATARIRTDRRLKLENLSWASYCNIRYAASLLCGILLRELPGRVFVNRNSCGRHNRRNHGELGGVIEKRHVVLLAHFLFSR